MQAQKSPKGDSIVPAEEQLKELAAHIRSLIDSTSLSRALKTDKDADAYMKARSEARLTLHRFGL